MSKWLLFLALAALCYVVGDHELIRYRACADYCARQQESDRKLIQSVMCTDIEARVAFESTSTLDCAAAENRARLTVGECARNKWRLESEWWRIWRTLTESYIRLVGIILPITLAAAYWLIGGCFRERRQREFMDSQQQFMASILDSYYGEGRREQFGLSPRAVEWREENPFQFKRLEAPVRATKKRRRRGGGRKKEIEFGYEYDMLE